MSISTLLIDASFLLLLIAGLAIMPVKDRRIHYGSEAGTKGRPEKLEKVRRFWKDWLKRRRLQAAEREIYEGISFLRNLLTLNAGRDIRADQVLEQLSCRQGVLKPVYLRMLGLLRLNRHREAIAVFQQESGGDPAGREYASLLIKWDEIDPADLAEIMISMQRSFREKKITRQKRQDEVISDLIFLPVMLNVVVLFLNFLVVAFFLQQQEMLSVLF